MKTIKRIRKRAEEYRRKVFLDNGNITINHDQTRNKIFVPDELLNLSVRELQEVGYILMHMSRNERLNAIIENDHVEYWSLVNSKIASNNNVESWINRHNPLFSYIVVDVVNHLELQYKDVNNKKFQNLILNKSPHDFFPAVWAGFAYLEGLCRRICNEYVEKGGKVKKEFKVCGEKYGVNDRVSNLKHILICSFEKIEEGTKNILYRFFDDYTAQKIYNWRNDSLHGAEDRSTTIIVLYCLISILLLDLIKD